jgi:ribonuclease HI
MIFSDGGARGNPGPSAIAFIIQSETGKILTTNSSYIGLSTNNQAEYQALIQALETAIRLKAEKVTCHLDSELVVKQLSYEYRVKNQELRKLWLKVQELKSNFSDVKFVNVPRSHIVIQKVDKLVNQTLDATTPF